jgi:hypothetical protein
MLKELATRHKSNPKALYALGSGLAEAGDYVAAVRFFLMALALDPNDVQILVGLGVFHAALGNTQLSKSFFDAAERGKPLSRQYETYRAEAMLDVGEWTEGFARAFRILDDSSPTSNTGPRWRGEAGPMRLLVGQSGGIGDGIMLMRYAALLKQMGITVIWETHGSIVPLARTCPGIDQVVTKEDKPEYDRFVECVSLPHFFRTTPQSIPAAVPYMRCNTALVDKWRSQFLRYEGLKVGIAWQGSPANSHDHRRSMPLSEFGPLANISGVQLFSLQSGTGIEQLKRPNVPPNLVPVFTEQDDPYPDENMAAAMKSLDIIISICSAPAHLAGALAAPVWTLLPHKADWRWLRDRSDSPWYPTMRLFRQKSPGNWSTVFDEVARELAMLAAHRDK